MTEQALKEAAFRYLDKGLSVLPGKEGTKVPNVGHWKAYQSRLPVLNELETWLMNDQGILCIVCGKVSGNLEVLDFDCAGEKFNEWMEYVQKLNPKLYDKLVIESTPSQGFHVYYRCKETEIPGARPLARKLVPTHNTDLIEIHGKKHQPKKFANGDCGVVLATIETRGEGSMSVCSPSKDYVLLQGNIEEVNEVSKEERELLIESCTRLNEYFDEPSAEASFESYKSGINDNFRPEDGKLRPGDDFNIRGDVKDVLLKHGWQRSKEGENEHWVRPGKNIRDGNSATLKNKVFYVFSSSAAPFEPGKGYSPFQVYVALEYSGNYSEAARALRQAGYGDEDYNQDNDVDLSLLIHPEIPKDTRAKKEKGEISYEDPGPMPDEYKRVPGFISEFQDFCLDTAPYPNLVMAFCGGLTFQGYLAGRKVMDSGGLRTNLYVLGLGHSGSGKDWPRKVCKTIAKRVGLENGIGEKIASGEGLEDALNYDPSMLFLYDEFDTLLQSLGKEKTEPRLQTLIANLLTFYTSSDNYYKLRTKANVNGRPTIEQPCLNLFGTAIPNHYYDAVTVKLLTNGLFGRMIVVEGGMRGFGQEAKSLHDIPHRLLETANYWSEFVVEFDNGVPIPEIVEKDKAGRDTLIQCREEIDREYMKAQDEDNEVEAAIWARFYEQVGKLSLIYAISENYQSPVITKKSAEWAMRFATHSARRMLFQAFNRVSDNPFHKSCLKLKRKLHEAPNKCIPHSVLLKRMKIDRVTFHNIIETLIAQEDIVSGSIPWKGKLANGYQLVK